MPNWTTMLEYEPPQLAELVEQALRIKHGDASAARSAIAGRILTMLFFNPSLRTRASFEAAMIRFGGHAVCLNVAADAWKLEHRDGVVMDGECPEHIREAAPVLSRYGHALAVRSFARLQDPDEDARDEVLSGFARHATVPVINMESAAEHPCQGLADWLTVRERLGETRGRRFVLSWAPHVKALPLAVPHSAILAAAAAGMHVTVAHPPGYGLHARYLERATAWCQANGATFEVVGDQRAATRAGDIVYVKSWGAPRLYGDAAGQARDFEAHRDWTLTRDHLSPDASVMHCLPVRRNLVIADEVLDSEQSIVIDQAENRLWAQVAILTLLLMS